LNEEADRTVLLFTLDLFLISTKLEGKKVYKRDIASYTSLSFNINSYEMISGRVLTACFQ